MRSSTQSVSASDSAGVRQQGVAASRHGRALALSTNERNLCAVIPGVQLLMCEQNMYGQLLLFWRALEGTKTESRIVIDVELLCNTTREEHRVPRTYSDSLTAPNLTGDSTCVTH